MAAKSFLNRVLSKGLRVRNDFSAYTGFGVKKMLSSTPNLILMYHGVNCSSVNLFNRRHARLVDFEKQIKFMIKHGHIISLKEFFLKEFKKGRPNFAITFDDGYENNFLYAKPVLEAAKVPATIFVTGLNQIGENILWPDFLNIASKLTKQPIEIEGEHFINNNGVYISEQTGKDLYFIIKNERADYDFKFKMMNSFKGINNFKTEKSYDDFWRLMTDEQIRICSESKYIEIGSHSYFHNNLSSIKFQDAVDELSKSKNYLESLIQKPVSSLAYPDGSYTRSLIDEAYNIGFHYQLAAEGFHFEEDSEDFRIRDRVGIYSVDTWANQLFTYFK